MLKFVVILYKRPDLTEEEFLRYYRETNGPMAESVERGLTSDVDVE